MPGGATPHALLTRLLDLLFPPVCAGCGARGAVLCDTCRAAIEPPGTQVCARCHMPLGPGADVAGIGLCARCLARGDSALAGLRIAARYDGPLRSAIWALKYHGQRRLANPLGDLLASAARPLAWSLPADKASGAKTVGWRAHGPLTLLVPVPLHPARQRQRGYNQSELLAQRCGVVLGLPVHGDLLARIRATPPQVGRNAVDRRANVAGAFTAIPHAAHLLEGSHVLLVDDVCTSGATMAAAAGALRAAGVASVWGLAVAQPSLGADGAPVRPTR